MTSRWSNPTGGLAYHLRASLRRGSTWEPFTRQVARWLHAWSPPERALLLVGPSGGHCLDVSFLARFARITAVDIDPFAPWFFRRRARDVLRTHSIALAWDARDYLSPGPEGFAIEPLRGLLAAHPDAAVLFCNILGQLPLLGEDRDPEQSDEAPPAGSYEHWLHALPGALEGRSWATFHDRLSGGLRPHDLDATRPVAWSPSEELVARHYRPQEDREIELVDHRTGALLTAEPRWQFEWQIAPGLYHLIEALSFKRGAAP